MNRDKPSVNLVEQPAIINIIMHAIGKNEQIEEHLILPVKHAIFALVRNHIPIPIEILIQIRAASKDAQVELDALKKSIESSPPVRSLGGIVILPTAQDIISAIENLQLKAKKRIFYHAIKASIGSAGDMHYGKTEDGTISCIKLDEDEESFVNDTNRVWIEGFSPTSNALSSVGNETFGLFGNKILLEDGTEVRAFVLLPYSGKTELSILLVDSPYDNTHQWGWFLTNKETGLPAVMRGETGSGNPQAKYITQEGSKSQQFRTGDATLSHGLLFEQTGTNLLNLEQIF